MSYQPVPPIASMLLVDPAARLGRQHLGGSMVAGFENLPAALKERAKTLQIKHDGTRDSGGNLRKGVHGRSEPEDREGPSASRR